VFLLAHAISEVLDLVAFILLFAGAVRGIRVFALGTLGRLAGCSPTASSATARNGSGQPGTLLPGSIHQLPRWRLAPPSSGPTMTTSHTR
jgi:hypothetical protein